MGKFIPPKHVSNSDDVQLQELLKPCTYLRCFFNVTFYFGFSPYQIVYKDGRLIRKTITIQKLVSLFLWISTVPWIFRSLYVRIPDEPKITPSVFIHLLYSLSSVVSKFIVFEAIWFKADHILEICNLLAKQSIPRKPFKKLKYSLTFKTNLVLCILTATYAAAILTELFSGKPPGVGEKQVSHELFWDKMTNTGRSNFFYGKKRKEGEALTWIDHFCGVLTVIGLYGRYEN